jgi:hypothetical protein
MVIKQIPRIPLDITDIRKVSSTGESNGKKRTKIRRRGDGDMVITNYTIRTYSYIMFLISSVEKRIERTLENKDKDNGKDNGKDKDKDKDNGKDKNNGKDKDNGKDKNNGKDKDKGEDTIREGMVDIEGNVAGEVYFMAVGIAGQCHQV